jgi:hypothetical protein
MRLRGNSSGLSLLILGLPVLAGSPFLVVGLYEVYKTERQLKGFRVVRGVVVSNSYATINDNGTLSGAYYPVVEFFTESGEKVRFTDGAGSLPPDYEEGASVNAIYNPANVREARIKSWKRLWLAPMLLCFIGLLPILAGISALWFITRSLRRTGNQ